MVKLAGIIIICVLICLLLSLVISNAFPNKGPTHLANNEQGLLQFTSGGHVIGFAGNYVYLAGLDHALRIEFIGASPAMPVAETSASEAGAGTLHKVTYRSAWKNIDVIFTAAENGISESTYLVYPGGNPASIRIRYNAPVYIQEDGSLRFTFNSGYMTESAPLAWQEIDGQRIEEAVAFQKDNSGDITIALASYDSRYPVYIDPTYSWHTFFGTLGGNDTATSITLDNNLNVYIAGFSTLQWNGPAGQAPLNPLTLALFNTVIVKLSNSGAYLWHTYYPHAVPIGLARTTIVADGPYIYISGGADASWNGPAGQLPLYAYNAGNEIFILKLDQSGGYQWHTFYGSTADDVAAGMKAAGGYLYITGWSCDTWNGPAGKLPLHAYNTDNEIFVLKLGQSGGYEWHTFYGGSVSDRGWVLALDSQSNIYVGGYSDGTWNGPLGQTPLTAYTLGKDAFVLKLSSAGAYLWHTFYGGALNDWFSAMAVDNNGNVYTLGYCQATWNGPAGQSPLNAYTAGADNVAILKLSSDGSYQWHTFYRTVMFITPLGGGLAVDSDANVYVGGISDVTQLGPDGQAPLYPYVGGIDIIILKLNNSGAYQWHAFYGGTGNDAAIDLALDPCNIYIDGISTSTWNSLGGQLPLNAFSTGAFFDIVALKMANVTPAISLFSPATGGQGTMVTINGTGFLPTTTVFFGGVPAASVIVNSTTQLTAIIGAGAGGQITVSNDCGNASSSGLFNFIAANVSPISPYVSPVSPYVSTVGPYGSSGQVSQNQVPQLPVSLPNIVTQSASLSARSVTPGTPVTVTADLVNKSAVNGNKKVTLYVNGQVEWTQGVTVNSGGSTQLTFNVSRSEPGDYTVYVDGVPAGSFKVEMVTRSDSILIFSAVLVALAFLIGILMLWRRQRAV